MTRRITCYILFVTLIWGAHTDSEERRQDMFKSNTTRNDFSNLLSSLIKLNEQRVNVLQKLNRLEDYGVLSEVLRSSDKTVNGNSSNLFLIVMSKNPTDSSHRNNGYQLVDSVTSLEVAGSNNIPKLDYVLDPASFVFQNDRKEHNLTSIFANTPRVNKQKNTTKNRIIKITTTKQTLQYRKAKQRNDLINLFMTSKDPNESQKIKIVRKNKSSIVSKRLLNSSTLVINDQSTRYNNIKLTIKKHKLTTKPITIKDILLNKRKKIKFNLQDKVEKDEHDDGSPLNISFKNNYKDLIKKTTQINGDLEPETDITDISDSDFVDDYKYDSDSKVNDVSVKKSYDNNHPKPGTDKVNSKITPIPVKKLDDNNHPWTGPDKVISEVTDISVKKIDDYNHPKPGTDEILSKVNVNSVKKIDYNNPKPETNVNTLKAKNIQGNQHTKLIRNNSRLLKFLLKQTDKRTKVLKNADQIIKLNGTVGSDNASESNHTFFNVSPIPNPKLNINKDNAYADDFIAYTRRENATKETDHGNGVPLTNTDVTLSVATSNILAPLKFPETAKNTPNRDISDLLWNPNNSKENSNNDKMKTATDLHTGDNHNDVKEEEKEKRSSEVFTLVVADKGKGGAERVKVLQDLQLPLNGQPETKPIARKIPSCWNTEARRLCRKACKNAYKNVCRRMKCKSKAKRALEIECDLSCGDTFYS